MKNLCDIVIYILLGFIPLASCNNTSPENKKVELPTSRVLEIESEYDKLKSQTEIEEQNIEVVKKWLLEINKDNFVELFDELWSDSCRQYFNSSTEPVEYDDFKQMIFNMYREYPVIEHRIHDMIACGDKVAAKFSASVVHDTTMFGAPPTGKEIEWSAIAIFQLSNGKIQNRWEITDLLGMYEQLGMELQLSKR